MVPESLWSLSRTSGLEHRSEHTEAKWWWVEIKSDIIWIFNLSHTDFPPTFPSFLKKTDEILTDFRSRGKAHQQVALHGDHIIISRKLIRISRVINWCQGIQVQEHYNSMQKLQDFFMNGNEKVPCKSKHSSEIYHTLSGEKKLSPSGWEYKTPPLQTSCGQFLHHTFQHNC